MKIIGALLILLSFQACAAKHLAKESQCGIIHEPKSGCPKGFTKEKRPRFTEKDGKKQFACVAEDPKKEHCVDVLMPGESMEMLFMIEVPDSPRPGSKT